MVFLLVTAITENTKLCSCSFPHISTTKTFMVFQWHFDGKSQILLYFNKKRYSVLKDTTARCFIFQRPGEAKGTAYFYFIQGFSHWLDCWMFRVRWQVIQSMPRENVYRKPRLSHSCVSVSSDHSPNPNPPQHWWDGPPEGCVLK